MRLLTLTATALLLAAPLLRADDRRTPPDADSQAKAEALIKDLFKEDFAKRKPADLQALASKLIQQAADTKNDAAGQFVLLRLAAETAARAGDAADALQAVNAQAKDFAVSAPALKAQALDATLKATGAQIDYEAILDAALPTADEAQAADDFDAEGRLLHAAQVAAAKLGAKQLATVALERGKLVEAMQKEFDNIKADLDTLKDKPEDPNATLHVGRFLCFYKGDWDRGLPLLAICSDAKLKDLAKKDLNGPSAAADQAALADAWMDVADGEAGTRVPQIQLHAYSWYKQAAPQLAGLDKTKAEKKIKDLDKVAEKLTVPNKDAPAEQGWVVLFRSFDPALWDKDANLGKNNFAVSLSKAPDGVQFLKMTLLANKDYVIVPMTNANLKSRSDDGAFGWQGEAEPSYMAYHLGVYALPFGAPAQGQVSVAVEKQGSDAAGWGFGNRANKNDIQGYCWKGLPIGPTVFEISVKAGALTDAETKHLVKKKDK